MTAQIISSDVAVIQARDIAFSDIGSPAWVADFRTQTLGSGLTLTRASNASYISSSGVLTTASNNIPRFDFDAATGAFKGLLIEEQRTNFLLNSASPASQSVSLSTGTYTLWLTGTGSCACAAGTATGTGFGTATSGSPCVFTLTGAGSVTFTVSGTVTVFQCENGGFATSFITTTAAAATRSADLCASAALSWYNPYAGTWLVDCNVGYNAIACVAVGMDDGIGSADITRGHILCGTTQRGVYSKVGGTEKLNVSDNSVIAGGLARKLSFSYGPTGGSFYQNGVKTGSAYTASISGFVLGAIRVGYRVNSGTQHWMNERIRSIRYYPNRLLDEQMRLLTL